MKTITEGYTVPLQGLKNCWIRLCDNEYEWYVISGNSDALCNEDSRDINCALCENNFTCVYSNYPFNDDEEEYFDFIEYRDKMRNSDVCSKCVYNEHGWKYLDSQEERMYKLIEIERKSLKHE